MTWISVGLASLYAATVIWDITGSRVIAQPQRITVLGHHIGTVQVEYRVKGRRREHAPLLWCLLALAVSASHVVRPDWFSQVGALLWLLIAGGDLRTYIRRAS